MPKQHTYTTYSFEELSEEAQARAVGEIRERLGGEWWDSYDTDSIGEIMLYVLAEKLRSPGWDTYGPGDFPGIDALTVDSWDLDRGESYNLSGTLTRENAPALPWPEDAGYARIGRTNIEWTCDYRDLWYADSYPEWMLDRDRPDCVAFWDAWDSAVSDAIAAGREEVEYQSSEERAGQYIECNAPEFDEDGSLA